MLLSRSVLVGALLIATSYGAHAQISFTNGDFSTHSSGYGQLTVSGYSVTGWTGGGKEGNFGSPTTPPVFLFSGGSATGASGLSTGVNGDGFMGNVKFYGGSGLTPTNASTPVIAADGDPAWGGSISQTITGLTLGNQYTVTFDWAGAQQQGFSGNTTESWTVSLGNQTFSSATVSTPSQTFAGWQNNASMTFTADGASDVLKFLANGSPSGEPPWLLLSNVRFAAAGSSSAPEPGALALVGSALTMVGGFVVRKRRRATR